jgi:hypothetical protein
MQLLLRLVRCTWIDDAAGACWLSDAGVTLQALLLLPLAG